MFLTSNIHLTCLLGGVKILEIFRFRRKSRTIVLLRANTGHAESSLTDPVVSVVYKSRGCGRARRDREFHPTCSPYNLFSLSGGGAGYSYVRMLSPLSLASESFPPFFPLASVPHIHTFLVIPWIIRKELTSRSERDNLYPTQSDSFLIAGYF